MNARPTDWTLLLEIGLGLLLIGLSIVFFWRPAAMGLESSRWWHGVLLGALFFGIIGLHRWRRGRSSHAALRETIRDETAPSGG